MKQDYRKIRKVSICTASLCQHTMCEGYRPMQDISTCAHYSFADGDCKRPIEEARAEQ